MNADAMNTGHVLRIFTISMVSAAVLPILFILLSVFDQYGYPDFVNELVVRVQISVLLWLTLCISIWITLWSRRFFSSLKKTIIATSIAKGISFFLITVVHDYSNAEYVRLHTVETNGNPWSWAEMCTFLLGEVLLVVISALLCALADFMFAFLARRRHPTNAS